MLLQVEVPALTLRTKKQIQAQVQVQMRATTHKARQIGEMIEGASRMETNVLGKVKNRKLTEYWD